jgi:hypothetical protein
VVGFSVTDTLSGDVTSAFTFAGLTYLSVTPFPVTTPSRRAGGCRATLAATTNGSGTWAARAPAGVSTNGTRRRHGIPATPSEPGRGRHGRGGRSLGRGHSPRLAVTLDCCRWLPVCGHDLRWRSWVSCARRLAGLRTRLDSRPDPRPARRSPSLQPLVSTVPSGSGSPSVARQSWSRVPGTGPTIDRRPLTSRRSLARQVGPRSGRRGDMRVATRRAWCWTRPACLVTVGRSLCASRRGGCGWRGSVLVARTWRSVAASRPRTSTSDRRSTTTPPADSRTPTMASVSSAGKRPASTAASVGCS